MNIPDDVKIEKYGSSNIVIDRNSNNVISGQIKNTQELIDKINPSLKPLFDKYVNSSYNFQKLDTLDDDIERYIKTNILPRYFSKEIYAYVKYSSKLSKKKELIVLNKIDLIDEKEVKSIVKIFSKITKSEVTVLSTFKKKSVSKIKSKSNK